MVKIKWVKGAYEYSPNIKAVINFPDNPLGVPARGYVMDIDFSILYKDLDEAAKHFTRRTENIHQLDLEFVIGFIKGKDWRNEGNGFKTDKITRDITYFPFKKSNGIYRISEPFMVESFIEEPIGTGPIQPRKPNIMGDMLMIGGYEEYLSRISPREEYIKNFPDFPKEWGLFYAS